jgi:hypothetical protein
MLDKTLSDYVTYFIKSEIDDVYGYLIFTLTNLIEYISKNS